MPNGKPDYRTLQELVATVEVPDAPRQRAAAADTPVDAAALQLLFAELLGADDVTVDSSFVSLGGDSLSCVEMSVRLEDALGTLPRDGTRCRSRRSSRPRRRWHIAAA